MNNRLTRAFDDIRADEELLRKTAAYLQTEREKRGSKQGRFRPLRLAGALAAMLALVAGILGYRAFYSAAAYVGIDVNPSLELALNRFDRVIDIVAYNSEGESLLREASLIGRRYDEAAASLISMMEQNGYLGKDALVTLTVQTADGAKERALCDALVQSVNGRLGSIRTSAEVEAFPVTRQVREAAHGCHMSAAKYLAIQELMGVDETATLEEYSGSTIQQIRQRTQTCREGHGSGGSSVGSERHQGQGGGRGHGPHHVGSCLVFDPIASPGWR